MSIFNMVYNNPSSGNSDGYPTPESVYAQRPSEWISFDNYSLEYIMSVDNNILMLINVVNGRDNPLAFNVYPFQRIVTQTIPVPDGPPQTMQYPQDCLSITYFDDSGTVNYTPDYTFDGGSFKCNFDYATFPGKQIDENTKQLVLCVSSPVSITEFALESHPLNRTNSYNYNIVEMFCNASDLTIFNIFGTSTIYSKLVNLQYINIKNHSITNMSHIFDGCSNLKTAFISDTSSVTDMSYMFNGCTSLEAIPLLNTSSVTNISNMFAKCTNLPTIPLLNTSNVTTANYTFQHCYSLKEIPLIDISKVTSMNYMFNYCYNLTTLPALNYIHVNNASFAFSGCAKLKSIDLSTATSLTNVSSIFSADVCLESITGLKIESVASFSNSFSNCFSLRKLLFKQTTSSVSSLTINLSNSSLSHDSIIALFNILPSSSSSSLNLSGNPGTSSLTSAEKAIITGKGWSLTA